MSFFTGQCIGNYNPAIFLVDTTNLIPIRSTGEWEETYVTWTSGWHSHFGCGVDDPLDRTLTAELPTQNRVAFANLIWDVNRSLEVGFEVSHWDTDYAGLGPNIDNDAMVYHTRVSAKFQAAAQSSRLMLSPNHSLVLLATGQSSWQDKS